MPWSSLAPAGIVLGRLVHPDLLGPDADLDRVVAVDEAARDPDPGVVAELGEDVAVGLAGDRRRQQVADAEEAGHEAGGRALVEALGVAQLLVLAAGS